MARKGSPATLHHVAVNKLKSTGRKVGGRRIQYPWRKKARVRRKLTYAERKVQIANRLKKKVLINERLKEIREWLVGRAIEMKEEFGGHDYKYYYRLILQTSRLVFSDPQSISLWNAFVSSEFAKLNEGKYYFYYYVSVATSF